MHGEPGKLQKLWYGVFASGAVEGMSSPGSGKAMALTKVLRIVVASPSDVQQERGVLDDVVAEVNRGVAADRCIRLEVVRWETDAHPGFDPGGPQGLIDPLLGITDCDFLIGIFWKHFGTPTQDAKSGTEHEIRMAYESWKRSGKPQILIYFNERPAALKTSTEADQWALVLRFKENFPKEGLWWSYRGSAQFEKLARNHLTQYVRDGFPLAGNRSWQDAIADAAGRAIDTSSSFTEDIAAPDKAESQPAIDVSSPTEAKPRSTAAYKLEPRPEPRYLVGDEDTTKLSPHEQSLRSLDNALKRIAPSVLKDLRIRDEVLDTANRALLLINPLVKALNAAAKEETEPSTRYDLQHLAAALGSHVTTVTEMLSKFADLRSERMATSLCASLAREATALLAVGERSIYYVT